MQLFFSTNIEGKLILLNPEESRHCIQVLRHKVGDKIEVIDGKGNKYKAQILDSNKKRVTAQITEQFHYPKDRKVSFHIALAPTKNISRFEWFLEKATEIGIDEITPILCNRSERKIIKAERLEKVLRTALKQSGNIYLPKLHPLTKLSDFLQKNDLPSQRFIAHCIDNKELHLIDKYKVEEDVVVLIGPEGDFSSGEVQLAAQLDYQSISLGKSRLRTETAGIVACHTLNLKQYTHSR